MHAGPCGSRECGAVWGQRRPSPGACDSQLCAPPARWSLSTFSLPVASLVSWENLPSGRPCILQTSAGRQLPPLLTFKLLPLIGILLCQGLGNAVLARCYFWQMGLCGGESAWWWRCHRWQDTTCFSAWPETCWCLCW